MIPDNNSSTQTISDLIEQAESIIESLKKAEKDLAGILDKLKQLNSPVDILEQSVKTPPTPSATDTPLSMSTPPTPPKIEPAKPEDLSEPLPEVATAFPPTPVPEIPSTPPPPTTPATPLPAPTFSELEPKGQY